jgi:DNA-directed RNA polymerase beta' subunit
MQLVIGDMMMKDAANRDIPYLAMASYADGDSPMSYWASAMSGRKSTYDVQAATGKVGYLGKQATNITHNTPIAIYDCGTKNTGIPVKAQSTDNVGALLLRPWHNHPAGSVVT